MANKIWKEVFLIMCSSSRKNARNTERFSLSLRITDDYALQTLCCSPHKVCNEEGKLDQLPLNRALRTEEGEIYDITAGNMLIVGLGEEDFSSLTKDQLAHYEKLFHQPETFIRLGGHLMAIPIPDKEVRKAEKARKQEAAKKSPSHDPR